MGEVVLPAGPGRGAWITLIVVFVASVVAAASQFLVPPLLPDLMRAFGVNLVAAGALMSVFGAMGALLALPSAAVLDRIGPQTMGVGALVLVVFGSATGALASDLGMLLVARVAQGSGVGLIAVVAPAVVADSFELGGRGAPMGIWATWTPVAGVLMLNMAAPMAVVFGWRTVWWFVAGLAGIAAGLFGVVIRSGPTAARTDMSLGVGQKPTAALRNRRLWQLALGFAGFCGSLLALNTFMPIYLSDIHGLSPASAASTTSLFLAAFILGSPLAGVAYDRVGSRGVVAALALAGMAVLWPAMFAVDVSLLPGALILLGVLAGCVAPTVLALAPDFVTDLALAPMAIAMVMLGQGAGNLAGPTAFAGILDANGWVIASRAMACITAASAIAVWSAARPRPSDPTPGDYLKPIAKTAA